MHGIVGPMHVYQGRMWQQKEQIVCVHYIPENRREQSIHKPIGS
jgi:hypothetical protein